MTASWALNTTTPDIAGNIPITHNPGVQPILAEGLLQPGTQGHNAGQFRKDDNPGNTWPAGTWGIPGTLNIGSSGSGNYPEIFSEIKIKCSEALPCTPPACNLAGLITGDFFSVAVKPGEDPL